MARNRRHAETESLELLLDTICNVFGGMILMAILVVVQTQSSADRLPGPKQEDLNRALVARRLRAELERTQRRHDELAAQQKSLKLLCGSIESPRMTRLDAARERFKTAIDKARGRLRQLEDDLPKAKQETTEVTRSLGKIDRRLKTAKAQAEELKGRARSAVKRPHRKVRLPHRQGRAPGLPRYYVVKHERAYPLSELTRFNFDPADEPHCHVTVVAESWLIRPKQGMGYAVPRNLAPPRDFLGSLTAYSSRAHYIVFFVYDDSRSFESFLRLKETVLGKGYRYTAGSQQTTGGLFRLRRVSHHETE